MGILNLKGFSESPNIGKDQVLTDLQKILQISELEASSLLTTLPTNMDLRDLPEAEVKLLIEKLTSLGIECEIGSKIVEAKKEEKIADSVTEIEFSFDEESDVEIDSSPSKSAPPVYTVNESNEADSNGSTDKNLLGEIDNLVSGLQTSPLKKSETGLYESLQSELAKFNDDRKLSDFIASAKTDEASAAAPSAAAKTAKKSWGYKVQSYLRSKQGRRRVKEVSGILGVGILIILMAMPFMNQDEVISRKNSMKAFVEQLISLVESKHVKKEVASQAIEKNAFFIATGDSGSLRYSSMFNFKEKYLNSITLLYSAPPPRALTDDEIVNRVKLPPWLKKVDLSQLVIENKDSGEFVASGQARIVVEQDGDVRLFTGLAAITGKHDGAAREIDVKVLVNKGFQNLPTENYVFDYDQNSDNSDSFRLYISENLKIRYSEDVELLKALSDDLSSQLSSVAIR